MDIEHWLLSICRRHDVRIRRRTERSVEAAAIFLLESDNAGCSGIERIVGPSSDIFPGMNRRAALSHEHHAWPDCLAVADFGAEILRL